MARHRVVSPLQLAIDLGAASVHTGITLWWRWPILFSGGATAADRAELASMIEEKTAAAVAGIVAAQTESMRFASRYISGHATADAIVQAPATIIAAALKPSLRRVKANSKRLSRKR